jgi:short subunit fatty acids transporter
MDLLKNKMVLGLVAAAACAGLLYWWWGGSSAEPLLNAEPSSPLSSDLLATLGSLNTITLDETIFSDETFRSLTDFGVTIPPQAIGRRNPFAPL